MSTAWRWSSRNGGFDRWTVAPGGAARNRRPRRRCCAYLRRIDDLTTGKLRWGILTNGARWRLYYAGARSVAEQFFELDLVAVLGYPDDGREGLGIDERAHWLKVFWLVFGRGAFLPGAVDERTFHERAIEEGRFHQERVAGSLSALVFENVFPDLVRALAEADAEAPLPEVPGRGAGPAVQAALRPLRRRPGPPARPRQPLRRLRAPRARTR